MSSETLAYDGVYMHCGDEGSLRLDRSGKLKLAAGGLGWREDASGRVETLAAADIGRVVLLPGMRGAQVRVYSRDASKAWTFDAPSTLLKDGLASWVSEQWGVPVETPQPAVCGWSVGRFAVVDGVHAAFTTGAPGSSGLAFDVPMASVKNAAVPARDELSLELVDCSSAEVDAVVDIRLFVPGDAEDGDQAEAGASSQEDSGEGGDATPSVDQSESLAEALCHRIKQYAQKEGGAVVAALPDEVACQQPRGRVAVEFGATALRLRGKSYDHRVPYSAIVRALLLPRADEAHVLLVLQLDPPLRQGQTRYPFAVFSMSRDEPSLTVEVDRSALGAGAANGAAVEDSYSGPPFEVFAALLRALAGQKVIVPGGSFASATLGGLPAVRCAYKANDGFLYCLERGLVFLPKPVVLVAHAEIAHVEAARVGGGLGNPRSFDVRIVLRRPLAPGAASVSLGGARTGGLEFALSNIAKEEWEPLSAYLAAKGVDVRLEASEAASRKRPALNATAAAALSSEDEDEEEDDEYAEGDSDEYGDSGSGSDSGSDSGSGDSGSDDESGSEESGSEDDE